MAESTTETTGAATLRVKEIHDDRVVAIVPGTEYELHLMVDEPLRASPGERIRGEIHAKALRMHQSDTGGQFIEPIYGTPRIVQGLVAGVDATRRRVLMEMPLPVWVTIHEDNDIAAFRPGDMWNCYVESGTRFISAAAISEAT